MSRENGKGLLVFVENIAFGHDVSVSCEGVCGPRHSGDGTVAARARKPVASACDVHMWSALKDIRSPVVVEAPSVGAIRLFVQVMACFFFFSRHGMTRWSLIDDMHHCLDGLGSSKFSCAGSGQGGHFTCSHQRHSQLHPGLRWIDGAGGVRYRSRLVCA